MRRLKVEVLVTVVIHSVRLLGWLAAGHRHQAQHSSLLRVSGDPAAYDIIDSMRANQGNNKTNLASYKDAGTTRRHLQIIRRDRISWIDRQRSPESAQWVFAQSAINGNRAQR